MGQRSLLAIWKKGKCLGISDAAEGRESLDGKKKHFRVLCCYQPISGKKLERFWVWEECELSVDVSRGEMRLAEVTFRFLSF